MKARRVKREYDSSGNTKNTLVFFGSYGLNVDKTAKFYNENDKHDNFSENKEAVADSLLVKLNILEGELWYNISYGWPIWDNHKTTHAFDVFLSSTILQHEQVKRINSFDSKIEYNKTLNRSEYIAKIEIITIYGELLLDVNQTI